MGINDRKRPNSSGAVIDELDQMPDIPPINSSRSSSKLGGSRNGYPEVPSQQDSSHIASHHPARSSSAMSSHGMNAAEYSVLKFNTNNIGTEIDVDMGKGRINVTGGGIYNLDDNSKLRYALTSKSDLMLTYEYKFSNTVCGSVGTTYSLTENNMTGPLGYKLKFDC